MLAHLKMNYQKQHVYRAPDVEACCEEINVESFVKLPFCLEKVRETERASLKNINTSVNEVVQEKWPLFTLNRSCYDQCQNANVKTK